MITEVAAQDRIRYVVVRRAPGDDNGASGFNMHCDKCKGLVAGAQVPQRGKARRQPPQHKVYCGPCAKQGGL